MALKHFLKIAFVALLATALVIYTSNDTRRALMSSATPQYKPLLPTMRATGSYQQSRTSPGLYNVAGYQTAPGQQMAGPRMMMAGSQQIMQPQQMMQQPQQQNPAAQQPFRGQLTQPAQQQQQQQQQQQTYATATQLGGMMAPTIQQQQQPLSSAYPKLQQQQQQALSSAHPRLQQQQQQPMNPMMQQQFIQGHPIVEQSATMAQQPMGFTTSSMQSPSNRGLLMNPMSQPLGLTSSILPQQQKPLPMIQQPLSGTAAEEESSKQKTTKSSDNPNAVRFLKQYDTDAGGSSTTTSAESAKEQKEEEAATDVTENSDEDTKSSESQESVPRTAPDPLQDPSFLLLQKKAKEMAALLEEAQGKKDAIDEKMREIETPEDQSVAEEEATPPPTEEAAGVTSNSNTGTDPELKLLEELKQQLESLKQKGKKTEKTETKKEEEPKAKSKATTTDDDSKKETEDERQRRLTKQRAEFYKNQKKIALRGKMQKKRSYMLL